MFIRTAGQLIYIARSVGSWHLFVRFRSVSPLCVGTNRSAAAAELVSSGTRIGAVEFGLA